MAKSNHQLAKQLVENEDPRVVEALIEKVLDHNESLQSRIDRIEAEKAKKDQESLNIEEQVKVLRKKMFGRSKEDRPEASDRPRDKSQQEALLFSQSAFPSPETREGNKKGKGSSLKAKEIYHELSPEELAEESRLRGLSSPSSKQWEKVEGSFDKVTKIHVIERKYVEEKHHKSKYKLKDEYNDSDKDVIITAKGPESLLPGLQYTTDFTATVASDKYIYHMPLERQSRKMEAQGLKKMKTSTLTRHCALAAASLEPIQEKVLGELKNSDLALHLDETPWKVQRKDQKDGFMWIVSNRYGSYYFFKPTRSGQVIKDKLEGYSGPVMTDGFSGYNALEEKEGGPPGITQSYCWGHGRRYFIDLEKHDPSVKASLDDIDELFRIERQADSFDHLSELRGEQSAPVVKQLRKKLEEEYPNSRPGSQKRKAIEYVLKRWEGFTAFLTDIRIPLSNNEAERTIRHSVVGRKNFYGAATHSGAHTAATLYTVIESCKKNDIDPQSFIHMALKMVAEGQQPPTPLQYAKQVRQ